MREKHKCLLGYDLQKLTDGFPKCDGVVIGSATTQQVCEEYASRRRQFKCARLNWRVSNPKSFKYFVGWIPFQARAARYKGGQVHFAGHKLGLWDSYGLSHCELRAGSLSEDSRGRWYLNVQVKIPELVGPRLAVTCSVGIDLGLKTCATASDGQKIEGRFYRGLERKLGIAQRAGKKQRARAIHAKIANQRKDMLHKFTTDNAISST